MVVIVVVARVVVVVGTFVSVFVVVVIVVVVVCIPKILLDNGSKVVLGLSSVPGVGTFGLGWCPFEEFDPFTFKAEIMYGWWAAGTDYVVRPSFVEAFGGVLRFDRPLGAVQENLCHVFGSSAVV